MKVYNLFGWPQFFEVSSIHFTGNTYTYKNQSIAKSSPIPSDGTDSVVQIMTIVTSEELGIAGSAKVKTHASKL